MDRKKLLISGASIAFGAGLPDGKNSELLWGNMLAKELKSDVSNVSVIGIDNQEIFFRTCSAMFQDEYDLIIVQWQSIPVKNLMVGFETYDTSFTLCGVHRVIDLNLVSGQVMKAKKIIEFRDELMRYHKEHWEIRELVYYCNVLSKLAKTTNSRIKFLNYNLPWKDNRYFDIKQWDVPGELDPLTLSIVDAEFRNDDEVKQLYELMHSHYSSAGNINESEWLNLYDPLKKYQIDYVSNSDKHPGIQSQEIFKNLIISWLT